MPDIHLSMDLLDKPWKSLKPAVEKALNKTFFKGGYKFPADIPADITITINEALKNDQVTQERLYYAALSETIKRRKEVTAAVAVEGKKIQISCKTMATYLNSMSPDLIKKAKPVAEEIQASIEKIGKIKNQAAVDTQKAVTKAINDAWAKLQKQNLDLQIYKIKSKINVAKRVVTVTKSVAKVIGTGGVHPGYWATLINDLVGLIKKLKKLCESYDSSFQSLLKETMGLEKKFKILEGAIQQDKKAGKLKRAKHRMTKMKNWFGTSPTIGAIKQAGDAQAKLTLMRKAADAASNAAVKLLDETEDIAKLAKKNNLPEMAANFEKRAAPKIAKMLDTAFALQAAYTLRQKGLDRATAHLRNLHVLTQKYEKNYYDDEAVTSEDLANWARKAGIEVESTKKKLEGIKKETKWFGIQMGIMVKALKSL